jgi:glycosyltransferase involved in cell wall biosynthesis
MAAAGDASALAGALVAAASGGPRRERIAAAGRATARRFTWEAAAAAHEAVYEGLRVPA